MERSQNNGLWVLLILLVMCLITIPRLDWDGLWYDEVFSIMNAGGVHYGPLFPIGIWKQVVSEDPYQALGYPYLLAIWGALVGWSEFATRLSSLFFAILSVAITFRLGRSVVSPIVGVFAALILGVSTFYIHYAHELRAYTLAGLFSAILLWSYIRLIQQSGRWSQVGFVVGGVGLIYTHYFGAMLLIGISVYHLFFVQKKREWWRVIQLTLVISVLFLPQIVAFLEGLAAYDPDNVAESTLSSLEIVRAIVYYIGNKAPLLVLLGLVGGVLSATQKRNSLRVVILVTVFSLAALLIANAVLNIIEPTRLRYAVFLWPALSLWIAAGLGYFSQMFSRILGGQHQRKQLIGWVGICFLFWFVNGVERNFVPEFTESLIGNHIPRLRAITTILREEGTADDLFAFDNGTSQQAWYIRVPLDYATAEISMPTMITSALFDTDEDNQEWAREQISNAERIWYGMNRTIPTQGNHEEFLLFTASDFRLCRTYISTDELLLQLYTREVAHCPDKSIMMTFGDDFMLTGYQQEWTNDTLTLHFGWDIAENVAPEAYSMAVHIAAPGAPDVILAQADIGFEQETFASMSIEIDGSQLMSGQYVIWLTVYDWQTGERLQGFDNRTHHEADRLALASYFWFKHAATENTATTVRSLPPINQGVFALGLKRFDS